MADINLPVITKRIVGIFNQQDSLVVVDIHSIWKFNNGIWESIGTSPEYDFAAYFVGLTRAYAICNRKLYERSFDSSKWTFVGEAANGTVDGDNFWTITLSGERASLCHYNPDRHYTRIPTSAIAGYKYPYYVGCAAIDSQFWFANRQRSRDIYNQTKSEIPQEAVFEFDVFGNARDVTENLGLLNRLGQPFGPVGNLIASLFKDEIYLSTEEGIWRKEIPSESWEKIRSADGNHSLFPLGNGAILASNRNKEVLIYNDESWYACEPKIEVKFVAEVRGVKYITDGDRLTTIDKIESISIIPPKLATYINIADSRLAVRHGDIFYITDSQNNLFFCSTGGQQEKLGKIASKCSSMCLHEDQLFLATLDGIVDGSNSSLNIYGEVLSSSAIIASNGTNLALFDKGAIKILDIDCKNKKYSVLVEKELKADYVTEIAFQGNLVYVVGFRNQKNKGVPVQSCFLECYVYDGTSLSIKYKTWGMNGALLTENMADTRLYKVVPSSDGGAVVFGETAGGNTAFRWDGQGLEIKTLVTSDVFNDPYNSKSAHLAYIGVVDNEGRVVCGQLSIPRGKGRLSNTNRVKTLFVGGESFFLGTSAAYAIFNRDIEKFMGKTAPAYKGSDAAFLKVSKDLSTRHYWFTPGSGEILYFDGEYAIVSTSSKDMPLTRDGKKADPLNNDTYLIAFGG
jgi:hypothetical protein